MVIVCAATYTVTHLRPQYSGCWIARPDPKFPRDVLRAERHYNSILIKNYSQTAFETDPFGPGWSAQYFQRIKYFASGDAVTAYTYRPDGQVLAFNLSGTAWRAGCCRAAGRPEEWRGRDHRMDFSDTSG